MLLVVIPVSTEAPRGGVAQGGTRLRDVSPAAVAPQCRGGRGGVAGRGTRPVSYRDFTQTGPVPFTAPKVSW